MPRQIKKPLEGFLTKSQRQRRGRKKESRRARNAYRLTSRIYYT